MTLLRGLVTRQLARRGDLYVAAALVALCLTVLLLMFTGKLTPAS